jgi:DNA sulfur modification protein DndD
MLEKLPQFFKSLSVQLLSQKKSNIERKMKDLLNENLVVYAGVIGRVELSTIDSDDITFKIFHLDGNEIHLSQLNAGAKQTVMQVLLKVLYDLGDYDPPVMIDTVMGVMSLDYRDALLENYFPNLASQTILLSTDVEITAEHGFPMLRDSIARVYTLHRDKVEQCTNVTEDYFGLVL